MRPARIPFLFMRGGSSRGPFLQRRHLPEDPDSLAAVLVAMMGSGHRYNIDGIGGGTAVTTKVAMLSPSRHEWAEVDYFFAQVSVLDGLVDYKPTCGNMLAGVGPAAIEMGLVGVTGPETTVRIHAVNTGALVEAIIQTRDGAVEYDGSTRIDGVPGTASPIHLNFRGVVGSSTGALTPTGARRELIDGIAVSCIDVAMPMVIALAEDFGLTGYETAEALDENSAFYDRMEPIRREAGRRMGLGDVSKSVMPKFGLISAAQRGGTINARYFMPWNCHPTMAVTGAQCLASCALLPGSVADGLVARPAPGLREIEIEHPSGSIQVTVQFEMDRDDFHLESAGLVRTARLLADGHVMVPGHLMAAPI